MARHAIATSNIEDAVSAALGEQSWFMRRKDTIAAVAGTVLQLANVGLAYTTDIPDWGNIVIAAVIGVCQVLLHATTPGAITPSMAPRLEAAAPTDSDPKTGLPVYSGITSKEAVNG